MDNAQGLTWRKQASGIWSAKLGSPPELNPLSVTGMKPKLTALERMNTAELPFSLEEIETERTSGGWMLRIPLTQHEQVYGFGLQFMKMNHRGRTRYLRVNSDPKQDTGESHAPVPFYVTDRGYGLLINTARIVTVHCGSTVRRGERSEGEARDRNSDSHWKATPDSGKIEILLPMEGAEIVLFAGETMLDVVRRYNLFSGGGTLPPRWGLGFWHRVPTGYDSSDVIREALEFRERGIPCDVIGLEPGWHSKSYPVTFDWSPERFPNPAEFMKTMEKMGFRVNLWEHPYVSPEAEGYEDVAGLSGNYSVWGGAAPDYSLPEVQDWYSGLHERKHADIGIAGYKLDECDGSELTGHSWMFPAHARFPSGYDGEQMRQLYGLLLQQLTSGLFRRRNRRTYGLVRASNAGAAPLPYVLYSDLYDHRQFVRALCNSSFSGLLWTPEVRSAANAEDWVRRMQTVCFSPLAMLNAWGDGTKPWSYPEAEPIVRRYIKLRMRLIPYLYSVFAQYDAEGTPPFLAMPLIPDRGPARRKNTEGRGGTVPDTAEGAYGRSGGDLWDDQYMIGGSLLVAPMFAGETSRKVYLPEGVWYGLETGERWTGGQAIHIQASLDRIPVFVRDGAVLPLMPALPAVPRAGERVPLDIYHFGESPGRFLLYEDDGETFDYEQGDCAWRTLEVRKRDDGTFAGSVSGHPDPKASGYESFRWHFAQTRLTMDD
ncbi:TIM-barrel domain-containing protein [Cohnella nanjingensis]|uniref:DUF5110 domain-containing protein n=1 Tax=Cohnella nanjingensis TaxID=1387779 RepID=A0A7X0RUG2_9BACL|nr:TIM-barrel domain-containing protein [Cohnella nanjingensis]MBB6673820.1 DUF5110 domain-containing protein [Cohnella nanjingensis]